MIPFVVIIWAAIAMIAGQFLARRERELTAHLRSRGVVDAKVPARFGMIVPLTSSPFAHELDEMLTGEDVGLLLLSRMRRMARVFQAAIFLGFEPAGIVARLLGLVV